MNWGICKMGRFREEDPKGEGRLEKIGE